MKKCVRGILSLLVAAVALLPAATVQSQGTSGDNEVESLLARMSPQERVGQLFLVTFPGESVSEESVIAELIQEYHIGGVLLRAGNQNLGSARPDAQALRALLANLQTLALSPGEVASAAVTPQPSPGTTTTPPASTPSPMPEAATPMPVAVPRTMVPLFIALDYDEAIGLSEGGTLSPQPSLMALGATWDTSRAEAAGTILGQELRALGVNVLLGPPLDVYNPQRIGQLGDLGTQSFGESPYWVGSLGRAYVRGVRAGAEGRVLAVVTHFPGLGVADRDVSREIPVIQDSLESRQGTDLLPFLKATEADLAGPAEWVDGILVTHVQFRDVTSDTQMTHPASLDPQALGYFLGLPQVRAWREAGGWMVSDSLGDLSVKRFYDPQMKSFQAKRVAHDAFLAGNDLLCLDSFGLSGDWQEHFDNVKATLDFFQSKYASDPTFRSRVDDSVRRILAAKRRLYPRFAAELVVPSADLLTTLGQSRDRVLQIVSDAVTLVYPGREELLTKVPQAPTSNERIVVFEDVRRVSLCSGCETLEIPATGTALTMLRRLYGEEGSGQVDAAKVQGYTFGDLWQYLGEARPPTGRMAEVEKAVQEGDWLIFLTQGTGVGAPPEAGALQRLLQSETGLIKTKRVVVISCGAPQYLDSTDVAKLSAFYAVYTPSGPAIEVALRALFREFAPKGISPVSISSVGYSLPEQLRPAPEQMLYVEPVGVPSGDGAAALNIGLGDEVILRTGVILDRNGHKVPDGTRVTFLFSNADSKASWQKDAVVSDGQAQTRVLLDTPGTLEIAVAADEAKRTSKLLLTIQGEEPAVISTVVPTPIPTVQVQPTPPAVFPGSPEPQGGQSRKGVDLPAFLLMLAGLGGICAVVWAMGHQREMGLLAVENALLALASGLVGYLIYSLLSVLLVKAPLLSGGIWETLSWRWQPAILSWIAGSAFGLAGVVRPGFARRLLGLLVREK